MIFAKRDYKILLPFSVAFLLFLGLNLYFNYTALSSNIKRYESELFSRVHGKIESWNASNFKDVDRIAGLLQSENISSKDGLSSTLERLRQGTNFPYVILGLDDGSFYISDSSYVTPHNYDLKSRAWYNDTLKAGQTIASEPYISMRLGLRSVSICTPVRILSQIGVMCGGQPFDVIRKYFQEYQSIYDKNLYLISKNGEILASFGNSSATMRFENVDESRFAIFGINQTNWRVLFEKDKQLFNAQLSRYLLLNLMFYAFFVVIYAMSNYFWFAKNKKDTSLLNAQDTHIKEMFFKQAGTVVVSCDDELNIVLKSKEFDSFFDLYQCENLKKSIQNSHYLTQTNKQNLLLALHKAQQSEQVSYVNVDFELVKDQKSGFLQPLENEDSKDLKAENTSYLLTITSFGNTLPYSLCISFCDVSNILQANAPKGSYNSQLETLLIFIVSNLDDESLCIQKIAHATGYSKYHIQRLFKEYTDFNIATFVRSFRLEKAKFLLKFSNEKISQIASVCGFSHAETFIRSFLKIYKISPLKYRQNYTSLEFEIKTEQINQPELKLAISHKPHIIDESNYIFVPYASFENKFYASLAFGDEYAFITIPAGKWLKIDLRENMADLKDCLDVALSKFYNPNVHLHPFSIYFNKNLNNEIDFLYIKI